MLEGVIIEQGPKNWQVIQQTNGSGRVFLSGICKFPTVDCKVYARVVNEADGDIVIRWLECERLESDRWQAVISDIPAGGLYRIETCLCKADNNWDIVKACRGDMIHHIGIGDIYVIAGQSNASGRGREPVYDPPEIGVHMLRSEGIWDLASHPLDDTTGAMHEEFCRNRNGGHSPFICFGRYLKRRLGYPVGLIQVAFGGSALNRWNPGEIGDLYGNMLGVIRSQGNHIKGILWYQGCADAGGDACDTYFDRFENMVHCLRNDLGNENLPFLTVQINRYVVPKNEQDDVAWGKIKEIQRHTPKRINNVFVVPSTDCVLSDGIHNSSSANIILGERLARTALTNIYGRNCPGGAPDLLKASRIGSNSILLTFENVYGRLDTHEVDAKELPFTVEDKIGKLAIENYIINGKNEILLILCRDLQGKAVVHGAYERNSRFLVPFDTESRFPMLSFYGVQVDQ